MDRPVIDQINVVTSDIEATAAFWRLIGIDTGDGGPWAAHHRESPKGSGGADLDLDSVTFARWWDAGWPAGATGVVVSVRVPTRDDVDATCERLRSAGHGIAQPPVDAFWGSRFAVVVDPDGNHVGIMSPADPAHRHPPPDPTAL